MADLPMAQIPNFQLPGPAQINQQPGLAQGLAGGVQAGLGAAAQLGQVANQAKAVQQQVLQRKMEMVDSLIKNGLQYPDALMPMFWPTIAKTMNEINPAYQMDPTKPPQNLKTWGGAISQTLDAVNSGVINLPQANQAVTGINKDHLQQPVPAQAGMESQQPPTGGGQPPLPGEAAYGAAYQQALNLPPSQIQPAIEALQSSPQAIQMKNALEQQKALALQKNTIQNERAQSLKTTFLESSKDFQQIAPDFRDFSTLMSQPMPADTTNMTAQDKQMLVATQKAALLKYVQMQVPASRRPPNMGALETLAKGGEIPQMAEDAYNRLFQTGAPLTGKQMKAIRATGVQTYLSAEAQQAQLEHSWAQNAKANGVDPSQILQNFRPANAVSTSQFFPNPSSNQHPLIGHIVQTKGGKQMHLGGSDLASPNNWANAND